MQAKYRIGWINPNGFYNNSPRVGIDLDEIPNPYLKSKNVVQYNFGFDAAFFDGKLDATFDTYYKAVTNELFKNKLDKNHALKKAFNALTPGRQRAYLFYFSQPKQSKTRESRIEKNIEQILNGKGLDD